MQKIILSTILTALNIPLITLLALNCVISKWEEKKFTICFSFALCVVMVLDILGIWNKLW